MKKLRESMKYIFIAVIVFFLITVVVDWGMGFTGRKNQNQSDSSLGKVNGKKN
jgi:hypothetical protein